MMMVKRALLLGVIAPIAALAVASLAVGAEWYSEDDFQPTQRIEVKISSDLKIDRRQAPVVIRRDMLPVASLYEDWITVVDPALPPQGPPDPQKLTDIGRAVKRAESGGHYLRYQLDDLDKDGVWDELFFMTDLKAGETKSIYLYLGQCGRGLFAHETHAQIGSYGRHLVPWWESKVVGWKLWFPDSVDMYAKRRPELVANHEIEGNISGHAAPKPYGNDILWVADTFGAAGICVLEDPANPETAARPRFSPYKGQGQLFDTRYAYHVIVNGPLRSIVRIDTMNWRTDHGQYACRQLYTAYAGKSYSSCRATFTKLYHEDNAIELGVGMRAIMNQYQVSRGEGVVISHGRQLDLWDVNETLPADKKYIVDWEAIALAVKREYHPTYHAMEAYGGNHLMRIPLTRDRTFEYLMFAGWSEGFVNAAEEEFQKYVFHTTEEYNRPLRIDVGRVEEK